MPLSLPRRGIACPRQHNHGMKPSSLYGTALVLTHLLVTLVHGQAHVELRIGIGLAAKLFVLTMTVVAPPVAMVLLWTTTHVRCGKAVVFSGCKSRPGTGSLHPVAIEAAVEV